MHRDVLILLPILIEADFEKSTENVVETIGKNNFENKAKIIISLKFEDYLACKV